MTFEDYIKKKSLGGRVSLRRRQYELALSGNPTMLIWLGKNWLGQTDKMESQQQISGPGGGPIELQRGMTTETANFIRAKILGVDIQ